MLQNIRNHVQGWVATLILVLISASFIIFGVEYYVQQSSSSQTVIAKVDGTKITQKQLDSAFQQAQRNQEQSNGGTPLPENAQQQLKQDVLRTLVINSALIQA